MTDSVRTAGAVPTAAGNRSNFPRGSGRGEHPAPHRHHASLAALFFGLFGAPAAWSVQLLVVYALQAHTCYPRQEPLAEPTVGSVNAISGGVSVLAVIVGLLALWVAWGTWRRTRAEMEGSEEATLEVGEGRTRFMALSGVMSSALFTLVALLVGLGLVLVPTCW